MKTADLKKLLRRHASKKDTPALLRFFKTGKGEYGEGDRFLGVRSPSLKLVAKQAEQAGLSQTLPLLHSTWHEERALALEIWTRQFQKADASGRQRLFRLYLKNTKHINNWDLVDMSAPDIIGGWLLDKPRTVLYRLAASKNLWERRIAIVSTLTFIRNRQYNDTLKISRMLLRDAHDLIHKATGWMLREAGKKDVEVLEKFLARHASGMPRTMLRYAIEKFPEAERRQWLSIKPLNGKKG